MIERYTPGLVETIALRYYDDLQAPEWVELRVDLEDALDWLASASDKHHRFFILWMQGATHTELATEFSIRERTVARLIDQLLILLSRYMSEEWPLDIPYDGDL